MTKEDFTILLMENATEILTVCKKHIKELASEYYDTTNAWGELVDGWLPEVDEWHGFSDAIDLNFYTTDRMTVWAYPVVNDETDTSTFVCVYATEGKS
jgi:hypothetical protein